MESFIGNNSKSTKDSCDNYNQEDPYGFIFDDNDAVDADDIEVVITAKLHLANSMLKVFLVIRHTLNYPVSISDYKLIYPTKGRWFTAR